MAMQYYEGVGRRKTASARVRLYTGGTGKIIINGKDGAEYLPRFGDVEFFMAPLTTTGQQHGYDVSVHVEGGGITGQRDAIRLGMARALLKVDADLRSSLKSQKFLSRDAREKERKKPGLKRARKAPTYTKR